MMSVMGWVTDAILVLLLTGTLCMAIRLDRALRVVRRDRAAFEALITNLGAATGAVKHGIQALRGEAEQAAEQIGRRSEEADKIATDLSFLIEAADRAGAGLEQRLKAAPADPADTPEAAGRISASGGGTKPRRAKAAPRPPATVATVITPPAAETPATAELHALAGITTRRGAADTVTRLWPAEPQKPDEADAAGRPRWENATLKMVR
jgi:hypothetical protein